MSNYLFMISSYSGALSVVLGAFGAHGLKKHITDPKLLKTWETAAHYQMIHSLLAVAATSRSPTAAWLALIGNVLFSGSLYAIVLADWKVGIITPIGGLFYIGAWAVLAHS